MTYLYIVICVLFTVISNEKVTDGAKLPEIFHRCKVTSSFDYGPHRCLEEAVQHAIVYLSESGDSELDLPDLDPLRVNEIIIKQGNTNAPVSIELVLKDIDIHGISNLKLKSIKGNVSSPSNFKINLDADVDSLQLIGDYSMNGKVLLFPVRGTGACNLTLTGIRVGGKITGEPLVKHNKEYVKIKDIKMSIELDRAYLRFENLFRDKTISNTLNSFINENWGDVYGELKPSVEEAISQLFKIYAKRIFERIPFKNIFILE